MVYDKKSFETTYKKRADSLCWDYSSRSPDLSEQSSIVVRGPDGKLLKLRGQFGEVGLVLAVNGSVDVVRNWPPTLVHVTWPGSYHFWGLWIGIMITLTAAGSVRIVTAELWELDSGEISRAVPTAAVSLVEVPSFGLEVSGEPGITIRPKKW